MCDHHIADDGPLTCTRPDPHTPGHGCTYQSTSGVVAGAAKEEM